MNISSKYTFVPLGGPTGGGLAVIGASARGEVAAASSPARTTSREPLPVFLEGKKSAVDLGVAVEDATFGATTNPQDAMLQLAI